jgi:cation diffusion facilitator CzcD-associated flavoprotein CzcO
VTHDVIAVGGHVAGFTMLDSPMIRAAFDDNTNTWTITTDAGQHQARVLLDRQSPLVPWIPSLPGGDEFRGQQFHAAAIAADFDPSAQRIAVVGADAGAGRLIGKLTRSGAVVTVFPLPPRRVVRPTRRARRYLRRQSDVVTVPIESLTASGIRTIDGSRHDVDTLIFGTGFSVSEQHPGLVGAGGQALAQFWRDGAEPYCGVAVHGLPNYFILGGPNDEAQLRYVSDCLQLMAGHTRIEVRRSSQQVFNERAHLHTPPQRLVASAFDLSSTGLDGDMYDGPATLTMAGNSQQVRVRLSGRVDPIDGHYHWQGTVFEQLSDELVRARSLSVNVGDRRASARITELTPQGTYSIAGVGAPPFGVPELELTAPQR